MFCAIRNVILLYFSQFSELMSLYFNHTYLEQVMYVLSKCLRIIRKVMSLLQQVAAWDKLDRGMRTAAVRCHIGVHESMICSIKKYGDKITVSVTISATMRVKIPV